MIEFALHFFTEMSSNWPYKRPEKKQDTNFRTSKALMGALKFIFLVSRKDHSTCLYTHTEILGGMFADAQLGERSVYKVVCPYLGHGKRPRRR